MLHCTILIAKEIFNRNDVNHEILVKYSVEKETSEYVCAKIARKFRGRGRGGTLSRALAGRVSRATNKSAGQR